MRSKTAISEIEAMIASFEGVMVSRPDYPIRLIGLAEVVASKKQPFRAFELCRKAVAAGMGDSEVAFRARRLLSSLVSSYHVPMNDARRNAAWDKAIRRAIHPYTCALEICTAARQPPHTKETDHIEGARQCSGSAHNQPANAY
jgi:hypothetical protein